MVSRDTLIPLDDDILRDETAAAVTASAVLGSGTGIGSGSFSLQQTKYFVGALLDFAEWDDHLRDSYNWPAFVHDLLRCDDDVDVDANDEAKIPSSSSSGGINSSSSSSNSSGERVSLARLRAWISAALAHPVGKHFRDPRKVFELSYVYLKSLPFLYPPFLYLLFCICSFCIYP